jgi:hypothetical protein
MFPEQVKRMPKVFIIEEPRRYIDVSSAEKFGEIIYLFKPMQRRVGVFDHPRYGRAVLQQLLIHNYDPLVDYLCIVGSLVTVSVALIPISQSFDKFKMLLFNSSNSEYIEKFMDKSVWKGQSNE